MNWYSRQDFRFHVYTKTDEPDPDTSYNFGEIRASRKMVAWGGTHSRRWLYDFSAGPESWAGNFDVDDADLDGDGEPDYRIPPIWEYDAAGYRSPSLLGLGHGPAHALRGHRPALHHVAPLRPARDRARSGRGEGRPRRDAGGRPEQQRPRLDQHELRPRQLRRFQPYYRWRWAADTNPIDDGAKLALNIFTGLVGDPTAGTTSATPFAQLFCYFGANLAKYIPEYRPRDYVDELFAFNTTADDLGDQFGLLGFADDDWATGTQSHVFMFGSPEYRELGFGYTTTAVHEVGHHLGVSHPHDG